MFAMRVKRQAASGKKVSPLMRRNFFYGKGEEVEEEIRAGSRMYGAGGHCKGIEGHLI